MSGKIPGLWQIVKLSIFIIFITVRNEVAKVMFLQASVCPRGEYLTRYTPREQTPPGTRYTPWARYTPLWSRHPPDQVHSPGTRCTPPEQTPPRPGTPSKQTPPWDQVHSPRADTPTPQDQVDPRDTVTAADGTHPTGMHSYSIKFWWKSDEARPIS